MIVAIDQLSEIRKKHEKVSLAHGVFDVIHQGHLKYLSVAKELSDALVVSITEDEFVNKGPGRPYFTDKIRAEMVNALKVVDYVVISPSPRATNIIEALKPNYYVKGPDYKDRSKDITGGIVEEELEVKKHGGTIFFTEDETYSSSTLINKFFETYSDEQKRMIDEVKSHGGMSAIHNIFDEIKKLKVSIIGEPIVDTYVFCEPQGISSKSPSVSAKFIYEENYAGGTLAIANALSEFVDDVTLFIANGQNELKILSKIDKRVKVCSQTFNNVKFPRKTRYIERDKSQRIFELTEIQDRIWDTHSPKKLLDEILDADSDVSLLCDFGHGLFEGEFLERIDEELNGFVALNSQTNSSNFGFNPYTKHQKFNYLSIDLREARVAFHDRYSDQLTLFNRLSEMCRAPISMTLGSQGSFYKRNQMVHSPAFASSVVDATGAGDMYYAMTALLESLGAKDEFIPFIGNIFAGMYTKIIGNKSVITKAQLIKALEAILK